TPNLNRLRNLEVQLVDAISVLTVGAEGDQPSIDARADFVTVDGWNHFLIGRPRRDAIRAIRTIGLSVHRRIGRRIGNLPVRASGIATRERRKAAGADRGS